MIQDRPTPPAVPQTPAAAKADKSSPAPEKKAEKAEAPAAAGGMGKGGARPGPGRKPGRPAASPRKANGQNGYLFLVETEPESGRFEIREDLDLIRFLELTGANHKIIASPQWRAF